MATIEVNAAYEWDHVSPPWKNYSVKLDNAPLLGLDFASGDHHWFQFNHCTVHDVEQDGVAGPCAPCQNSYRSYAPRRGPQQAWLESLLPENVLDAALQAQELTIWAQALEREWLELRHFLATCPQVERHSLAEELYSRACDLAASFTGPFELSRLGELEVQRG